MKIIFIDGTMQEFEDSSYEGYIHNNHPIFKINSKENPEELVHLFPLSYIKEIII